jgi:hypothetical protein
MPDLMANFAEYNASATDATDPCVAAPPDLTQSEVRQVPSYDHKL